MDKRIYFKYFKLNQEQKALQWYEKNKSKADINKIFCESKICYQVRKTDKVIK